MDDGIEIVYGVRQCTRHLGCDCIEHTDEEIRLLVEREKRLSDLSVIEEIKYKIKAIDCDIEKVKRRIERHPDNSGLEGLLQVLKDDRDIELNKLKILRKSL